ncbi:MAG: FimB/Mfa2 family fimbrial subunit, partial [Bacteroidales bacterium]
MKTQFYKTIKVFALVLLTACNTIYDNMPPCKVYFNFVYDKNMLYADAFHSQCDNVELFIFNQDSTFIKSATVSGDLLKQLDYKMEVPIEVGNYIAFAWVGIENSYKLSELKPGVSKIDDLKLKLKTESNQIQRKKIESLWHAEPITFSFNGERNICNTLKLTRNTNTIRIGIKTINADDNIEKRSYNVKIIADNST